MDDRMRIYVASRVKHAAMWEAWRAQGAPISSTWIDEAGEGETASLAELWGRIRDEVMGCDRLVFYATADDFPLKGALVEVGMALAFGKPIVAVLPGVTLEPRSMRPVGSWLAGEGVRIVSDVREALALWEPEEE
jgi:hypothetical protein